MAFPLDAAHLISHLRSSYLVSFDADEDAKRIITPYHDDKDGDMYKHIFEKLTLSSSPPIELTTSENLHASIGQHKDSKLSKANKRRSKIRHRRKSIDHKRSHSRTSVFDKSEEDPGNVKKPTHDINKGSADQSIIDTRPQEETPNQLNYTQTIKKGAKKKNNLIRLFQRDSSGYDSDSSDGSVRTTKLESLDEDDGLTDSTPKISQLEGDEEVLEKEDASSLTSKQSTLSYSHRNTSSESLPTKETFETETPLDSSVSGDLEDTTFDDDDSFDEDDEDDDDYDDDDDDYDDDDETEDVSSDDSAFTDLDDDSLGGSSLLLHSFQTPRFSYSKKAKMLSSKLRRRKSRSQSLVNTLQSTKESSNLGGEKGGKLAPSPSATGLSSIRNKKAGFKFEKIIPAVNTNNEAKSQLSTMIQSRYKSIKTNPLNYFAFANDKSGQGTAQQVKLNIFVPPKTIPTLQDLSVNNNVAIADCIGYILLNLSKLEEYEDQEDFSLYPNHWRLELVDEDGENYGSFGILDRTRLLSSYNNPKDLAICRVKDEKEIRKYELQSPLANEFKQNLVDYTKQGSTTIDEHVPANESKEMVELTIVDPTDNRAHITVDNNSSIQEVLYEFCSQRNLNPELYAFRIMIEDRNNLTLKGSNEIETLKADSVINDYNSTRFANKNEVVKELESMILQIVPTKSMPNSSLLNNDSHGISPIIDNDVFPVHNPTIIGSTNPKQATRNDLNAPITKRHSSQHIRRQSKHGGDSNKYFDDMISNLAPGIPSNPKARYFTWKVWRKKATILNKIEKSLIIDGDYIRLQPPEDRAYTMNPNDNPFLASQGDSQNHHHHHLHHYNYANYYNSSMMKTSSFHLTQITKFKQYKGSRNPNHFKIVIRKQGKERHVKKTYDLEAVSEAECEDIIKKIGWVIDMYQAEMAHLM
ncbi:hypothetical protein PSN45_005055 [Yamadazyma tenuis]|nr:hypothetical protein PSN45_005055 [Yamadazyma tenuis]